MKILGLHIGHDAAVCLIDDGVLKYAISEERLTRIKNHAGYPFQSVDKILKDLNLTKSEIDLIAIGSIWLAKGSKANFDIFFQKDKKLIKDISNEICLRHRFIYLKRFILERIFRIKPNAKEWLENFFRKEGFTKAQIKYYDHHLAHAASAYYASEFKESLIITQDGGGDGLYGGIYYGKDGKIETIHENKYSQESNFSLANIYAAVTKICGYKRNKHEGKITGLAAYGKNYLKVFDELIALDGLEFKDKQNFKQSFLRYAFLLFFLGKPYQNKMFCFLQKALQNETKEEIAYSVQKLSEKMSVQLVENIYQKRKFKHICLAGGLFANVRINQFIAELPYVENVYVYPNMGDGGLAVGAAYLAAKESNEKITHANNTMYLGNIDDQTSLPEVLASFGDKIKFQKVNNFEMEIAKLIANNKVVGYFSGRMEFGPRALCHRSMLINASDRKVNDIVNKRLRRTEFMPFAPVILEEDLEEYFENVQGKERAMNYMTITADVKKAKQDLISAVVHVDGTARPQTVNQNNNPIVHKILTEYKKITGISTFVNTSFNIHEEPIVCTFEDAIKSMLNDCVDLVCFDDYFIEANL